MEDSELIKAVEALQQENQCLRIAYEAEMMGAPCCSACAIAKR